MFFSGTQRFFLFSGTPYIYRVFHNKLPQNAFFLIHYPTKKIPFFAMFRTIINLISPRLKTGFTLYSDMPGLQAPHGGKIPPHVLTTSLRPDIFLFNDLSRECIVFELTCPWDNNIDRSHSYKEEKYSPLLADLARNFTVS